MILYISCKVWFWWWCDIPKIHHQPLLILQPSPPRLFLPQGKSWAASLDPWTWCFHLILELLDKSCAPLEARRRMKGTKRKTAKSLKIEDCFCCCEKLKRNKEENRLEDTFHCWPRSFHPLPVPADQTHFQKNILIRRESSSTKITLKSKEARNKSF